MPERGEGKEIVFILDASQSMNTHDKGRLAVDAGLDWLESVRYTGYTNAGEDFPPGRRGLTVIAVGLNEGTDPERARLSSWPFRRVYL